ncbi:hypothetical protein [Flavobacterium sp. J27]|uniref:hypothetical protein n=1 Tax=Flavobacterium sp. J27 TaxID=2060419 RepID=UPI00102FBFAD|nr:hypothetical protein [Flavobacterium sp. J27]
MIKRIVLLLFFNLLFCYNCFSQKNTVKNDSVKIYHDIHNYAKKRKFSKFVYRLFFRPSQLNEKKDAPKVTIIKNDFTKYNGKIIRKINITTLDPFGYTLEDTLRAPKKSLEKFGNAVHARTKKFTVKNLLLFKKYEPFDNLAIKESERLIREQRYIRRVSITPKVISKKSDSIDINVILLDSWSILPNGSLSSDQGRFSLRERNLFGTGHQISASYKERFSDRNHAKSSTYSINNIKRTYISFNAIYDNDFDNNSRRILSLNRTFFSALTKWAGGIYFENRLQNEPFAISTDSLIISPLKTEFQEYWLGHSFKLSNKKDYNSRTQRLVTSLAFNKKTYSQRPPLTLDPSEFFSNETNVISQIGIVSQKYYKDSFLFNYDIVEDVPYGEIAAINIGYQEKNNLKRLYLGSKIAHGQKYGFGYVSGSVEWGSFFYQGNPYQNTFKIGMNYFSPLFTIGKWKTRQFIKPSFIWGNHRDLSQKDVINLEGNTGILGFSNLVTGTKKWVLSLQTQTYSPGSWKGFRFSPYFNFTMGSIAAKNQNILTGKVYSKIGIGLLINNDYLVFNSFQVSFAYYPSIPFEGTNIIKTNSFENDDLSLPQFRLSKPYHIRYQ